MSTSKFPLSIHSCLVFSWSQIDWEVLSIFMETQLPDELFYPEHVDIGCIDHGTLVQHYVPADVPERPGKHDTDRLPPQRAEVHAPASFLGGRAPPPPDRNSAPANGTYDASRLQLTNGVFNMGNLARGISDQTRKAAWDLIAETKMENEPNIV